MKARSKLTVNAILRIGLLVCLTAPAVCLGQTGETAMYVEMENIRGTENVTVTGPGVGDVKDGMRIYAYHQEIFRPGGGYAGQTRRSGAPDVKPTRIVKRVNAASPEVYRALLIGEVIPRITVYFIEITGVDGGGAPTGWASMAVEYRNCTITSIRPWTGNVLDPISGSFGHLEEISFDSASVKWTARDDVNESPVTVDFDIVQGRLD